jgi:hypothetical protein
VCVCVYIYIYIGRSTRAEHLPDPWGDMQALLEEGRRLGGTHFVVGFFLYGAMCMPCLKRNVDWGEHIFGACYKCVKRKR